MSSLAQFNLENVPTPFLPYEEIDYRASADHFKAVRMRLPQLWASFEPLQKKIAYQEIVRDEAHFLEGNLRLEHLNEYARSLRTLSPGTFELYLAFLHEYEGFVRDVALLYELEQDPDCVHWQAADLSHLGEYEPYDWGDTDPSTLGQSLEFRNGRFVIMGVDE